MGPLKNLIFSFFISLITPFIFAIKNLDEETGGSLGTDAIVTGLQQVDSIVEDVMKATEEDSPGGKKITFVEGLGLIIADSGKIIKIINASGAIWDEIKDLETDESQSIIDALEKIYSPENPYLKKAGEKSVLAVIALKEAGLAFAEARKWEKDKTG